MVAKSISLASINRKATLNVHFFMISTFKIILYKQAADGRESIACSVKSPECSAQQPYVWTATHENVYGQTCHVSAYFTKWTTVPGVMKSYNQSKINVLSGTINVCVLENREANKHNDNRINYHPPQSPTDSKNVSNQNSKNSQTTKNNGY